MLSSCQYMPRVWLLRMIFVSSLRLSCSLKGDFYCILLQSHLADSNPLFALSRNTLKLVLGSELCDLMVGRGQNLQVISPPQDFLTLTQTRRPARLRVGALSVSYKITGLLKSLLSLLSGHPRLRGRQILLVCYAHSVSTLLCQNGETKEFGRGIKKKKDQHPISSQKGCGRQQETVRTAAPRFVRGFRERDDSKSLSLSVNLLFQCKFSI